MLVCQGSSDDVLNTGWLNQQKRTVLQRWRPEVQSGDGRVFPSEAVREDLL